MNGLTGYKMLMVLAGVVLFAFAGTAVASYMKKDSVGTPEEGVACTMDAKVCPDGSAVGRIPPDCEFAPCPGTSGDKEWISTTDPEEGIAYEYPADLGAEYISTQEWPPRIGLRAEQFACEGTPATESVAERVTERMVDDRTYCVEARSEGAAGSVYTEYRYSTETQNGLVSAEFTLRYPQCGNYDEPEQAACAAERESFDLDALIDRIVRTVRPA